MDEADDEADALARLLGTYTRYSRARPPRRKEGSVKLEDPYGRERLGQREVEDDAGGDGPSGSGSAARTPDARRRREKHAKKRSAETTATAMIRWRGEMRDREYRDGSGYGAGAELAHCGRATR